MATMIVDEVEEGVNLLAETTDHNQGTKKTSSVSSVMKRDIWRKTVPSGRKGNAMKKRKGKHPTLRISCREFWLWGWWHAFGFIELRPFCRFMDSGFACSYHLSPNREWFDTYRSVNCGSVTMGNDASCRVIGIGTIKLKCVMVWREH